MEEDGRGGGKGWRVEEEVLMWKYQRGNSFGHHLVHGDHTAFRFVSLTIHLLLKKKVWDDV